MGALANAIVEYAQPLFDETDGSMDQMNRAMTIAQLCWNLAVTPENEREAALDSFKPAMKMSDEMFADFQQNIVGPMIQRHHTMFPHLHGSPKRPSLPPSVFDEIAGPPAPLRAGRTVGRNEPCPCGSGKKYKRCCG